MKINLVSKLHNATSRNYLARMQDQKVFCMKTAKKYGKDYWDGKRRYGYGGYKYMPGRWAKAAKKLIKIYKLKPGSKILDVGCGKAFLLFEIKKILPKIKIEGFDISKYAIREAKKFLKTGLYLYDGKKKFKYKKNYFDLVISMATLHNFEIDNLFNCIKEIERVGKKKYIMVESYKNNKELFNLQCWALTCDSFFSVNEWKWIFKHIGYSGDYEFIFFN